MYKIFTKILNLTSKFLKKFPKLKLHLLQNLKYTLVPVVLLLAELRMTPA